MKIGIIVAMTVEFELVATIIENKVERKVNDFLFLEGQVGTKTVIVMKSGIGKVCSAVGAAEMIRVFQPDYILNTGVAGGIDASLRVMDMVVGKSVVYHDVWCGEGNDYGQVQGMPPYFPADSKLLQTVRELQQKVVLREGIICSGDRFITDAAELALIKKNFPAGMAVDMESGAIAQTCYIYGVPFLSLRMISDTPGIKDHAEQYKNFWTLAPRESFQVIKQLIEKL